MESTIVHQQNHHDWTFFFFRIKKKNQNETQISNLSAQKASIVNRSEIWLENTPISLSIWTWLKVLVKHGEKVRLKSSFRHQWCASTWVNMPNQMPIKKRRMLRATGHVAIAAGWPTGLAHDHVHVSISTSFHGWVHSIHHGVEHVCVPKASVSVEDTRIALEESVACYIWCVVEVWVGIDHEGWLGLA